MQTLMVGNMCDSPSVYATRTLLGKEPGVLLAQGVQVSRKQ